MPAREPKNTWALVLSGALAALLVAGTVALDDVYAPVAGVIRAAAVLGYLGVFLAILSSNYVRELTRFFGRRFVKVHHVVSVTALAALAIHAASVAWSWRSPGVFLPSRDTPQALALWFFAIASLTALLRAAIGKNWRVVHWLNYLAFLMGTLHAQSLGTNFQHLGVRIVSVLMALAVVGLFIWKRVRTRRARR